MGRRNAEDMYSFYELSSVLSDENDLLFTGTFSPLGLRIMSTSPPSHRTRTISPRISHIIQIIFYRHSGPVEANYAFSILVQGIICQLTRSAFTKIHHPAHLCHPSIQETSPITPARHPQNFSNQNGYSIHRCPSHCPTSKKLSRPRYAMHVNVKTKVK